MDEIYGYIYYDSSIDAFLTFAKYSKRPFYENVLYCKPSHKDRLDAELSGHIIKSCFGNSYLKKKNLFKFNEIMVVPIVCYDQLDWDAAFPITDLQDVKNFIDAIVEEVEKAKSSK